MTVQELINQLSQFDPNTEVKIAEPTGNYWGHIKAQDIEDVDMGYTSYSEYLRTEAVLEPDDETDESECTEVVVITY